MPHRVKRPHAADQSGRISSPPSTDEDLSYSPGAPVRCTNPPVRAGDLAQRLPPSLTLTACLPPAPLAPSAAQGCQPDAPTHNGRQSGTTVPFPLWRGRPVLRRLHSRRRWNCVLGQMSSHGLAPKDNVCPQRMAWRGGPTCILCLPTAQRFAVSILPLFKKLCMLGSVVMLGVAGFLIRWVYFRRIRASVWNKAHSCSAGLGSTIM